MSRWGNNAAKMLIATALIAVLLTGCQQFRVPAIDPSGERIFAPSATTLVGPADSASAFSCLPKPAFTDVAVAPPCPPTQSPFDMPQIVAPPTAASTAPSLASGQPAALRRGGTGALTLTPGRVIAPVGSEVVLVAGLCGPDGRYVTGRPIEWMLAQESVGNFVDVSGMNNCLWNWAWQHKTRKLSSNYALGLTSSRDEVIDRGTPTPVDDIRVSQGQCWLSITSATEGTSHVTALAPKAEAWDQRRQTAAIHWIDAQWTFPSTAIVAAGQKQTLTTIVTRSSNGSPIAGWIVRYDLAGVDVPAGFAPGGGSGVEVTTNANGEATVELAPQAAQAGTSQIQIQIIRPALNSGDLPRLVVGQGATSVTWSAPGLALRMSGPAYAGVEATASYRIEVSNPGDLVARGVVVSDALPPGLEFLNSQPPGRPFGDRNEWQLGDLPGRAVQVINVNCRVKQKGKLSYCATARSAEGLQTRDCAETNVIVPSLRVDMSGPREANVGDEVEFRIEVTNQSDQGLTNVNVADRYDAGLRHVEGLTSPIEKSLGNLQPRQSQRIAIKFVVTQSGNICHTLDVTADGGHTAQARSCLTAIEVRAPANPSLRLQITGPEQRRVDEAAEFIITVTNDGNVPLTDVAVRYVNPQSLAPTVSSFGKLAWTIAQLAPGETQTFQVNCRCLRAEDAALNRVTVTSGQGVTRAAETRSRIVPVRPAPPVNADTEPDIGPANNLPPAAGELKVELFNPTNPIRVGGEAIYLIEITNDRDALDQDVEISLIAAERLLIKSVRGDAVTKAVSPDERVFEMVPVATIRPRETLKLRVTAEGRQAGEAKFRVEVSSQRTMQPIQREKTTTVIAQ